METPAGNNPSHARPAGKRLHVVLLNQAFWPDVVATAQMSRDLAEELVRRGHRVTAIASRSIYGKSGAVLPNREVVDVPGSSGGRIDVHRVGASVFGKKGMAARVADFALFYALATLKLLTLPKADVVVPFTTPPFIALAGLIARRLRGSRCVYWVMDLYPDLPVACGVMKQGSPVTRFFEGLNRRLLRGSDVSVVLGRCMQQRVLDKGVPAEKVKLIPVWADLAGVEPVEHKANPYRERWAPANELLVMYSGNLGLGHEVKTFIDAMTRLRDEPGVKFVFVGGGKRRAEVEKAVNEARLTNVRFEEYQARERLAESLSAGDLHLISLREGVEGIMVPSKLFGIMAVARPSLFVGHPSSEIARVIVESGAGIALREGDGAGLAEAIRALKNDPALRRSMGERARDAVIGRFDRDTACAMWADLLERVCAGGPIESRHAAQAAQGGQAAQIARAADGGAVGVDERAGVGAR